MEWTRAYINDLPDSAFLYVESGGEKDDDGKTTPRSLRHFPYRDASGKIDLPHLRNAIARIPQSKIPADEKGPIQDKARKLLQEENERLAAALPLRFVLMAAEGEPADDGNRRWYLILPKGMTRGQAMKGPKGGINVTDVMIDTLVSTFGKERPVGVHHMDERAKDDPRLLDPELSGAFGWIEQLEKRDNGLWACINWTDEGASLISRKKFRYFSIEAAREPNRKTGEKELCVTGGTLTNTPFFDLPPLELAASVVADFYRTEAVDSAGMGPEDVSPADDEEGSFMSLFEDLSSLLGETVTEDTAKDLIASRLQATTDEVDTLKGEREELKAEIETLKASKAEATESITALNDRVLELEASKARATEDAAIDKALGRQAISKAQAGDADEPKAGTIRAMWRLDAGQTAAFLASLPDNYATTGGAKEGNGGGGEERDKQPSTEQITKALDAEVFLCALAAKRDDDDIEAVVAELNQEHDGEGTRLYKLMEEGYDGTLAS